MTRQSGLRLAGERHQRGLTRAQLAQAMGATSGRESQIGRGELAAIDAVARSSNGSTSSPASATTL